MKKLLWIFLIFPAIFCACQSSGSIDDVLRVELFQAGSLDNRLGDEIRPRITKIKLVGWVNEADLKVLRVLPNLKEVDLSEIRLDSLYSRMPDGIFSNQTAWKCLVLPSQLEEIGEKAFWNCTAWEGPAPSLEHVKEVGLSAFENCYHLKGSVHFSTGLEQLSPRSFKNCESLEGIVMDGGIERIPEETFLNCYSLARIQLPPTLKSIGAHAFEQCQKLTEVIFPYSLDSIQQSAFYATGLYGELAFPDNLTYLGVNCFGNCTKMRGNLKLKSALREIPENAFWNCTFLDGRIEIGKNVEKIGYQAFEKCPHVKDVMVHATTPPELDAKGFSDSTYRRILWVPQSSISLYQDHRKWAAFDSIAGF